MRREINICRKDSTWNKTPHLTMASTPISHQRTQFDLECNTCDHPKLIANTNHKTSKSINVKNKQTHKHTSGLARDADTNIHKHTLLHTCTSAHNTIRKKTCSNKVKCAHTAKHLCKSHCSNEVHAAATVLKSRTRKHTDDNHNLLVLQHMHAFFMKMLLCCLAILFEIHTVFHQCLESSSRATLKKSAVPHLEGSSSSR